MKRFLTLVAASLAVYSAALVPMAHAADPYPSKPIRIVIAFTAGGPHLRTSGAEDLLTWTDGQWDQQRRQ